MGVAPPKMFLKGYILGGVYKFLLQYYLDTYLMQVEDPDFIEHLGE